MIEHNGERLTIPQWAARAGVTTKSFKRRLNTMSMADALKPKGSHYSTANLQARWVKRKPYCRKALRKPDALMLALIAWREVAPFPLVGRIDR